MAVLLDRLKNEEFPVKSDLFHTVSSKTVLRFTDIEIRFSMWRTIYRNVWGLPLKQKMAILFIPAITISIKTPKSTMRICIGNWLFCQRRCLGADDGFVGSQQRTIARNDFGIQIADHQFDFDRRTSLDFSLFSSDILRIQQIIDISIEHHKKIAIIGRKTQRLVNQAMQLGYLHIPEENLANLRYLDEQHQNNDNDLVVLVTGERHEPYFMLQRMSKQIDRLIHLEPTDTIVILTNPYLGTEKWRLERWISSIK